MDSQIQLLRGDAHDERYERDKIIRYLEFYKDTLLKTLSPRQYETLIKRLEGRKLTQTEANYLSKSIRKKLEAARIITRLHLPDIINQRNGRIPPELLDHLAALDMPAESNYALEEKIQRLTEKMLRARRICILTGAGISRASGIKTYRGTDGRWNEIDSKKFSEKNLKERPEETIKALKELRAEMAAKEPNEAHLALAKLESLYASTTIITQNIDGLHQKAGSSKIIELHGNILRDKKRHGRMLPAATLFDEALDHKQYRQAKNLIDDADLVLIIGTSGHFDYIRDLICDTPAFTAEINPEDSQFKGKTDLRLEGKAEWILPRLYNELLTEKLLADFHMFEFDKKITAVYLFGSIAQGKKKLPHDIDLLLFTKKKPTRKTELAIRRRLREKLEGRFPLKPNITFSVEGDFPGQLTSVKKDVIENGVLLYGHDVFGGNRHA